MTMSTDLNDIRKVIADLEAEKNKTLCANQDLNEEICCLKKELCEHRRCEEKMREDLDEAENCITNLTKENSQLEKCLQNKDSEIRDLQKLCTTVDELNAYVCSLEKDIEAKDREKSCLEEQIGDLERCIHEKECQINRLESRLAEMETALCEFEEELKSIQDENDCLRHEQEECRCMLEKKNMELSSMCQRLKQCECEKQKLCCQLEKLTASLEDINDALQREQCNNCKLKEQVKCLQGENHKLCLENDCLHEENCDLCKKLDCVTKNLKKCQCEYSKMEQDCQAFKKSIGEFKKQIVMDLKGPCGFSNVENSKSCSNRYGGNRARSGRYTKSPSRSSFTELNSTFGPSKKRKSGACFGAARCSGNSPSIKYNKSSSKRFGNR